MRTIHHEQRGGLLTALILTTALIALACGGDTGTEGDDMASGQDMATGQDMPSGQDMQVEPDMPTGEDMTAVPDMAPDMMVEPDMVVEPDMMVEPDMAPDMEPDMPQQMAGWTQLSQPCGGTKTDALWFDDRNNGYIGCGTNAQGAGLHRTTDGGVTWTSQRNFMNARVNDVRRGPDGKLYGAGYDATDDFQVFQIDDTTANHKLVGLYSSSNNAFTSVGQGENIAITQDGQLFVDSLTGTQSAWRAAGAPEFVELDTFLEEGLTDPNALSRQMSQVTTFNNRFWAVGSRINEPAVVFVPSTAPGATYHMKAVDVQSANRDGELHDIHVWSETSALVVGFDQSTRYPFISRLNGDASNPANWTYIDVADSNIDYQGGVWNLHVQGDKVVIVGQTIPQNDGFVLLSEDRGQTWRDISPRDMNQNFAAALLTNVWMFADGTILAAGEGGQLWRYNP